MSKFPNAIWWARQGLNLRPHPCEGNSQFPATNCNDLANRSSRNVRVRDLYNRGIIAGTRVGQLDCESVAS